MSNKQLPWGMYPGSAIANTEEDSDTKSVPNWMHLGNNNQHWDSYTQTWHCYKHEWVDTGSRLQFCKHCDATGLLDPMTGEIEVVVRPKYTDTDKDK